MHSRSRPCHVALGDSMSIDLYPDRDYSEAVGSHVRGLGAATLFHRNNDAVWPEFSGADLVSSSPEIELVNLCVDGGVIDTVAGYQLPQLRGMDAQVVTLTVGGNDLLSALFDSRSTAELVRRVDAVCGSYTDLIDELLRSIADAPIIVGTVYDPSDGTGHMPGWPGKLPLEFLDRFNSHVCALCAANARLWLADIHAHFLGHGVKAPVDDRWYWRYSIIEPSARGASEIRRLWLSQNAT